MNQGSARKLLCVLFALAMAVGLLPAIGMPAHADGVTWDADQIFDSDMTINGTVTVTNDIELTINEGVTVTVNCGIDAEGKTVTVSGKGTLVVKDNNSYYRSCTFKGNIIVNGASIRVSSANGRAGADSPREWVYAQNGTDGESGRIAINGDVTVMGGSVTATGGNGGKGGKGGDSWLDEESIKRGRLCQGGHGGHGGSGGSAIKGNLTINGGSVALTGGNGAPGGDGGEAPRGIHGNGGHDLDGTVKVNGGNLTSTGGSAAKGGNGKDPDPDWEPSPTYNGEDYQVTKINYTTVEGSKTVQIDKATLADVHVIPDGLTYTGQAQTPKVTTAVKSVNKQPVTFTYSRTQDGPYGEMPTVTDVSDSGTFYYKACAPNHNDATGEFTVTVNKDTILEVVTPTPAAVTYAPNRMR